jgi:hypothetical protein
MPSKSKAQARLMAAAAHNPAFAKKVGIPTSVAKEFNAADKGKKFGTGGDVNYTYGGKGQINKQRTRGGSIFGVEKNVPNVNLNKFIGKKEGGMATESKKEMREEMKADKAQDKAMIKKAFKMHDKQEHKGSKGTNLAALKKGGKACMASGGQARATSKGEHPVQKRAKQGAEMIKMARGGGVETKGKTKGKFITMCGGGAMGKKK